MPITKRFIAVWGLLLVCCAVTFTAGGDDHRASTTGPTTTTAPTVAGVDGMVLLAGGDFVMGSDDEHPNESPRHAVTLHSFYIDKNDVTVAQFGKFVAVTGYKTTDEKEGKSWSFVIDHDRGKWEPADGVTWRCPDKAGVSAPVDEPVVQVSWDDAVAYAKWAGKRLPTEAEFEYAARGGLVAKVYAWGDDLRPGGKPVANWWQGNFPDHNTDEDGYVGRSPVGKFPANGYGLFDMTGNVWQWCADWSDDDYYMASPRENPTGPATGTERVLRGGSYLCAENYCQNYRVAGRSKNTPDSAASNIGFRCVLDAVGK